MTDITIIYLDCFTRYFSYKQYIYNFERNGFKMCLAFTYRESIEILLKINK